MMRLYSSQTVTLVCLLEIVLEVSSFIMLIVHTNMMISGVIQLFFINTRTIQSIVDPTPRVIHDWGRGH
jgi:hypothetical protein